MHRTKVPIVVSSGIEDHNGVLTQQSMILQIAENFKRIALRAHRVCISQMGGVIFF
jgi:hypothetical protein